MRENHDETFSESYPLGAVLWRGLLFVSLLILLFYIGIHWPG